MKELQFIEGLLPKGFKPDFESFLFNEERHRQLQSEATNTSGGWQSYFLVKNNTQKVLAAVHFHLKDHVAASPYKAPFGSIEFSKKLQPKDLYEFLKHVEENLRDRGVKKIHIKNPPEAYRPVSSSLLEVLLLNLGYRIRLAEISTIITVDEIKYEKKIKANELPKLKLGKKEKLAFQEVPVSSTEEIYEFIRACREERQQVLSMPLAELKKTVNVYPENFMMFAVYRGQELAAASISIRVTPRIVSTFYLGHPRKLDFLSPVVSLMEGIYGWSQKKHVELIDLGTSALEGQPNFNLLDFKLRLSGAPSTKFTFEKDLL